MPIYEYRCSRCDKDFELFLRTSEEEPRCPSCGNADVVKKLSACNTVSSTADACGCPSADSCPTAPCCRGGICKH